MFTVRRALISVSDKRNLVAFARGLQDLGIEILSTGGTCRQLNEAGITAIEVSSKTGFPEIMGGRVKTLHPVIHGGLLGRRGVDEDVMSEHGIEPIDLLLKRQVFVFTTGSELVQVGTGRDDGHTGGIAVVIEPVLLIDFVIGTGYHQVGVSEHILLSVYAPTDIVCLFDITLRETGSKK